MFRVPPWNHFKVFLKAANGDQDFSKCYSGGNLKCIEKPSTLLYPVSLRLRLRLSIQSVGQLTTTNHDCLFNIEILLISALLPERDIRINFDYSHLLKKRMQTNMLNCKINSTNGGTFSKSAETNIF